MTRTATWVQRLVAGTLAVLAGGAIALADLSTGAAPPAGAAPGASPSLGMTPPAPPLPPAVLCSRKLSVSDHTAPEGTPPVSAGFTPFVFTISAASAVASCAPRVVLRYDTIRFGTANPVNDFTETSGEVEVPAGDVRDRTIVVPVRADAVAEFDETFRLMVCDPATGKMALGKGTIVNDDEPPNGSPVGFTPDLVCGE